MAMAAMTTNENCSSVPWYDHGSNGNHVYLPLFLNVMVPWQEILLKEV
jgi:hypothetical protein